MKQCILVTEHVIKAIMVTEPFRNLNFVWNYILSIFNYQQINFKLVPSENANSFSIFCISNIMFSVWYFSLFVVLLKVICSTFLMYWHQYQNKILLVSTDWSGTNEEFFVVDLKLIKNMCNFQLSPNKIRFFNVVSFSPPPSLFH